MLVYSTLLRHRPPAELKTGVRHRRGGLIRGDPLARPVMALSGMTGFFWGLLALFLGFAVLMAVLAVLRRRVGGGFGPTELSDGSMTTTPTGYKETESGSGKKISSTDNNAARM